MCMEKMMSILLDELKKNKIKVEKWSKISCGEAYENRKIKIPKPIDFDTLGVCFHEIGHIVLGHMDKESKRLKKFRYVEEYEAEMFAIEKLREYGFYNRLYEIRAKSYVLMKISQAKNRGHNMREVPKDIIKWTGIRINKWNKAKRVFVNHASSVCKNNKDLFKIIQFYR